MAFPSWPERRICDNRRLRVHRSQRSVGLRRAAHTIFALISVLPLLLFLFFMWHFHRLKETTAQLGVLLAVLIALLGSSSSARWSTASPRTSRTFNRVVEGQATDQMVAPSAQAVVGRCRGSGASRDHEVAQAFSGMLTELRASTEPCKTSSSSSARSTTWSRWRPRSPRSRTCWPTCWSARCARSAPASARSCCSTASARCCGWRSDAAWTMEPSRPQVEVKVGKASPARSWSWAGGPGRGRREGPAVRQDQRSQVRRRLLHLRAAPGRRPDRRRREPGQEGADAGAGASRSRQTDLQFLNALMTYTAYAVDNARLFQEAREAAQRLQEVVEDQKLRLTLAQQQMLETAKLSALGELVAGVAHELNSPLTVLVGTTDLLEADGAAGAAAPGRAHEGRAAVRAVRGSRPAHLRTAHAAREDAREPRRARGQGAGLHRGRAARGGDQGRARTSTRSSRACGRTATSSSRCWST